MGKPNDLVLTFAGHGQIEKEAANWSRLSAAITLVVATT